MTLEADMISDEHSLVPSGDRPAARAYRVRLVAAHTPYTGHDVSIYIPVASRTRAIEIARSLYPAYRIRELRSEH